MFFVNPVSITIRFHNDYIYLINKGLIKQHFISAPTESLQKEDKIHDR